MQFAVSTLVILTVSVWYHSGQLGGPMKCNQCGKAAFYKYDNGAYLCVDCNYKVQQAQHMAFADNAAMLNQLAGEMEMMTGVVGVIPRIEIPKPPQMGHTVHNIKIDNSVIGAINTGQIKALNVTLDNVQNGGAPHLADALHKLTEAVLASSELTAEKKADAVEHLSHIANQAALPKKQRQAAISATIIEGFERIISVSSGLLGIWQAAKPLITQLF